MPEYTLYIQMPTRHCSGDITFCSFAGKYRTFFWRDNVLSSKLARWLSTIERDLGITITIADVNACFAAISKYE